MSLIWGAIMAIGGIVMCFTNHLEAGIALYATAGLSIGLFDISLSIGRISDVKKKEELEKSIKALHDMNDILDKIKDLD